MRPSVTYAKAGYKTMSARKLMGGPMIHEMMPTPNMMSSMMTTSRIPGPKGSIRRNGICQRAWEQPRRDLGAVQRAVQRRQGDEVEDTQDEVEREPHGEELAQYRRE